jgi:RHS repeat-associated protein
VIDANGYVTQYSYDNVGRVTQVASWDSGITDYSYNADGTLSARTDGRNVTVGYSYDNSARLTAVSFPDASENRVYSYDSSSSAYGRGRLTGDSGPWGSSIYHYDSLGRLSSEVKTVLGVSYTTSYGYDNVGNLASLTYPSGRVVTHGYNAVNRPVLVQSTRQGTAQTPASGFAYDNVDHLTSMTLGNGIVEGRGYDAMDRLSSISALPALSVSFGYDAVGNITAIGDGLTEAVSPDLGTTSYSYLANRLDNVVEGAVTRTYGYDNAGNTIWDGALEYRYNQDGRLKKVLSGTTTIGEYTYDGRGRRVIKTASGETRVFHYDRFDRLISESDASGNLLVDYVYLEDRPLAQLRPMTGSPDQAYYYHTDHLGTPKVMTDSTQAVVWKVPLDEFGNELAAGVRTVENNLRFPGQYFDQETGLHQNYFRDYDPKIGRYIEPDPIGIEGGSVNLYSYVQSDPVNYMDPWGHVRIKVGGKVYEYHPNDHHGVNPSEVHVHDVETKNKVGAESGNIYDRKGKMICGKINKKDLNRLQIKLKKLGYLGMALTAYDIYDAMTADEAHAFENLLDILAPIPQDRREKMLHDVIKNNPGKFKEVIQ